MPFNLFFIFVVIVWSVWEHLSIGPALRNLSKPDKVLSLVNISGFSIGHIQRFSTGQHIHFSTDTKYVQSFSTGSINRYEQHAKFRHYTCIYLRESRNIYKHILNSFPEYWLFAQIYEVTYCKSTCTNINHLNSEIPLIVKYQLQCKYPWKKLKNNPLYRVPNTFSL